MKTFSEFTNISLLHEILKNNTDKKVDYDTVQYDGNKIKFKTRSQFDGGIEHEYIVISLVLNILYLFIPTLSICLCPTLIGLIIWSIVAIFGVYLTNTLLLEHKPPFAILCTFLSLVSIFWIFTVRIEFMLENGQPCNLPLKLKEFFETIPLWIYKF